MSVAESNQRDVACSAESGDEQQENKRLKLEGEAESLPMLVVYDLCEGEGVQCIVTDHHVFSEVEGFHTDDNLSSFYSNKMHTEVLDEIGDRVLIYGKNLNSAENKVNALIELLQGPTPPEGQNFRATIILHPTL